MGGEAGLCGFKTFKFTTMKNTRLNRSNADSFEQLLIEVKSLKKTIKDIYYSGHIGNWTVQYVDGSSEEFETILQIMHDVIYNYNEQFKKSETLVL